MASRSEVRTALSLLAICGAVVGIALWRSGRADGGYTLYYHSLHFEDGVLEDQEIRSIDIATGRRKVVSAGGGICGELSYGLDASGRRSAVCPYDPDSRPDQIGVIDLVTGKVTPAGSGTSRYAAGWTSDGALIVLEQHPTHHQIHAVSTTREEALLYSTDRFVGSVVPMSGDTLAVLQSENSVSACERGGCRGGEIAIVRAGRVVRKIVDSAGPVIAFDDRTKLLYLHGRQAPELRIVRPEGDDLTFAKTAVKGVFGSVSGGGAALARDGRIALAGDAIFLFDARSYALRRIADGHGPIAWTPDGSLVYGRAGDRAIVIDDLRGRVRVLVRGEDVRAITVL